MNVKETTRDTNKVRAKPTDLGLHNCTLQETPAFFSPYCSFLPPSVSSLSFFFSIPFLPSACFMCLACQWCSHRHCWVLCFMKMPMFLYLLTCLIHSFTHSLPHSLNQHYLIKLCTREHGGNYPDQTQIRPWFHLSAVLAFVICFYGSCQTPWLLTELLSDSPVPGICVAFSTFSRPQWQGP